MLYEEFLKFIQPKIKSFFDKNEEYPTYENQFSFSSFNAVFCKKMNKKQDISISPESLKPNLFLLESLCDSCKSFYMQKRSDSFKQADIELGNLLEDVFMDYLNEKQGISAIRGDINNLRYPDCKILKDGRAIAYFEVKYHSSPFLKAKQFINKHCYEEVSLDRNKLIKQIEIINSEINVPVFFVHWIDYPCVKGIYFETDSQIIEELNKNVSYNRQERSGDFKEFDGAVYKVGHTNKFYPEIKSMGSFEELIKITKEITFETENIA